MDKEKLLAEIEDVLRTVPPRATIGNETPENLAWLGRASAVTGMWNSASSILFRHSVQQLGSVMASSRTEGYREVMVLLHQAQNDLRMQTLGPVSVAVGHGMVFAYFDELRKIIETARQDVFFIDPYLDAEFVSRYLPYVSPGTATRLLASKYIATLLPAVDAFANQHAINVAVRSVPTLHDRYVLIDKSACYQSGASFKDGAKKAGTTITQITDAFAGVSQYYENLWSSGKVER